MPKSKHRSAIVEPDRLDTTEDLLKGWESGAVDLWRHREANLELVALETMNLSRLKAGRPEDASRIDDLIARLGEVANTLQPPLSAVETERHLARIARSRTTLEKYRSLPFGTADQPEWLLHRIVEEVEILKSIAHDLPPQAESIAALIGDWQAYAKSQRRRAH